MTPGLERPAGTRPSQTGATGPALRSHHLT
jgi:hypothetical protein